MDQVIEYPEVDWEMVEARLRCATCGEQFTEVTNMGMWHCRMHPGEVVDGRFTCCKRKTIYPSRMVFMQNCVQPEARGCTPCDHRAVDDRFSGQEVVAFPENYLFVLNPKRASISLPPYRQPPGTVRILLCHRIKPNVTK